jgi:ATP-dependent Lhr-like helicase
VEREWVDEDVLRTLRRRSLARLRREVEPVDAAAFGRFLPSWQGVGDRRAGPDALLDAVSRLQGVPLPASVLEVDVLASRVAGYRPADLDLLCASGEVVWVGAGTLGSGDGRVSLVLRERAAALVPEEPGEPPVGVLHDALRAALAERGALFWPDLLRASATLDEKPVLAALWDLVWAGEVTNDTLAPVRAALGGAALRRSNRGRPHPGRLSRLGPPTAAGRWSLVAPLLEPAPSTTERLHGRARSLLERFGVVTREAVLAEGGAGGFAAVYGVLKAMEETGAVRRGYFVAGLGAAQFALPGAVDRLRDLRGEPVDDPDRPRPAPVVLAATDPANPYGAALAWPASTGRPSRTAGAHLVLVDGEPAVWVERGGRRLVTFPTAALTDAWLGGLLALVDDGRVSRLVVEQVDGEAAATSPFGPTLRGAGFREGYRGLVYGK